MHIFFSVGEASGDEHAAQMMEHLRKRVPQARFSGFGGQEMTAAGLETLYPLTNLAVMGIGAVIPLLWQFWKVYRLAVEFIQRERPDAVVLVDFPGFNWWVARAARKAGVPVYYYCPPQLWAWGTWRLRKLKRLVDCVFSVLPFEAEWYRERGVDVEYVGHPFFDEVAAHQLSSELMERLNASRSGTLVAVLPGSRKQEVERNFPVMLDIITELKNRHPQVRFAVGCYKQWHYDRCAELIAERGENLPIDLYLNATSEVIEAADCCLTVSGSISLEILARRKPAIVMYRGTPLLYVLVRILVRCKYMTLANLIAGREVMLEYPFVRRRSPLVTTMTAVLHNWICDPIVRERYRQQIAQLADSIVEAGGGERAAETLLKRLGQFSDNAQTQRTAA